MARAEDRSSRTQQGAAVAPPLSYTWKLTARPRELAHFRRLVKRAMDEWQQQPQVRDVVLQGVTELLSNVARHAGSPRCELTVRRVGSEAVEVSVRDVSDMLPVVSLPDWWAEEGRGLWMLREVANGLGWERLEGGGKRVWFRA
ncbi:ATP-binding protein [Streptomyces iconiensis]|uniref:ATP-binding protein n=1 Tax=Streptomyces iconiensis TaxID=1384038 RepID=A0ABT6ZWQ5_9ACTN|nr:ATP-binding protein [Streptomyces iconiensis]MDJ1133504.1 ATP-binding protein [Streptomyces iconiensis]